MPSTNLFASQSGDYREKILPTNVPLLVIEAAAHHRNAGGDSQILHVDPDLYIMQQAGLRDGNVQQSGLIYVLNNLGNKWSGATVKTKWKNQKFVPVAWDGHDTAPPNERTTNAEGSSEFPAPPRGYVVYAPEKFCK